MATLLTDQSSKMSVWPIIGRGLVAAHGTLGGAFYLFLLHAPAQVLGAMTQLLQAESLHRPAEDAGLVLLNTLLALGNLGLAVVVFFVFPFVLGGILGQVRDRLVTPYQPPGPFATYGRAYYRRLLGSLALFTLSLFVLLTPVSCVLAGMVVEAFRLTAEAPAPEQQQIAQLFLLQPLTGTVLAVFAVLSAAIGMVYWIANCMLVTTSAGVFACWKESLRFARRNGAAWLAVWLLFIAVSCLVAPVGLATTLGWVANPLAVMVVALAHAALIGFLGVLLAALVMSLYLARRRHAAPDTVDVPA